MPVSLESMQKGIYDFYQDLQTLVNPPKIEENSEALGLKDFSDTLFYNRIISVAFRIIGALLFVYSCFSCLRALFALHFFSLLLSMFVLSILGLDFIKCGSAMRENLPQAKDGILTEGLKYFTASAKAGKTEIKNFFFREKKDSAPYVITIENNQGHINVDKVEEILKNTYLCGFFCFLIKKLIPN